MTELARAMLNVLRTLNEALAKARARGEDKEEYYRRAAEGYITLGSAILAMHAYGKIDPETAREVESYLKV